MNNTSTLNQLLQLSYSELSKNEEDTLLNDMMRNEDLCDSYAIIENIKTVLNQEIHSPNPTSIKIILEESQRSELETH